jgi:hypothetical protein
MCLHKSETSEKKGMKPKTASKWKKSCSTQRCKGRRSSRISTSGAPNSERSPSSVHGADLLHHTNQIEPSHSVVPNPTEVDRSVRRQHPPVWCGSASWTSQASATAFFATWLHAGRLSRPGSHSFGRDTGNVLSMHQHQKRWW